MKDINLIADKVLSELKANGADIAQCTVKTSETREFNVDCDQFSLYRTLFDQSVSMVAFAESKKGSININRFDDEAIEKAAKDCLDVAKSGNPDDAWQICDDAQAMQFEHGAYEPDMDKFFMRTKELLETIHQNHPTVNIEQMITAHEQENVCYKNSHNVTYNLKGGVYIVQLTYSAHDGEACSSFAFATLAVDNLDTPFYEQSMIRSKMESIEKQVHTKTFTGNFEGIVLLTPNCVNELISTALDNFAGESALIDGTSIWKDKLGQQVADERLTISFNPLDKEIIIGEHFTHEGYVAKNYDVIKNGILNSFILSNYGANKLGLKRSENTSMNLVIQGGDKTPDEIIKSIDKGIIVDRFSGGSPAGNGEFSGVAKNSFMIENGKITDALSETMISGNLSAMLNNVLAISNYVDHDGINSLPYIAFSGITISGQ